MKIDYDFKDLEKDFENLLEKQLRLVGEAMEENISGEAPYDTGLLSESIEVDFYKYKQGYITSNVRYASYQDERTDFVNKGVEKTLSKLDTILKGV